MSGETETTGSALVEPSGDPPAPSRYSDPASARDGALGRALRVAAFPLLVVFAAVVLTALGLSGTSVGMAHATATTAAHDPDLVAGAPRAIRSDEWNVATPLIVAQSHRGYARYSVSGLGRHDLTVVLDIPNTDWSTAFKPWDLAMLALDVSHGFAARWWAMSVILLLGAYLLLWELTRRIDVAVAFSLGLWLSPFFHWWYESITLVPVGMSMLALAGLLWALRATTVASRVAGLAVAAYCAVGFVLVFYPPFQIPLVLILGAIGLAEVVRRLRDDGLTVRRVLVDIGSVGVVVVGVLAAYYLHASATIAAVTGTVYPGARRVQGGGTSLLQLLSAPFGVPLADRGASLTFTNQSEISSFLFLGPFALLQLFRLRLGEFGRRWRPMLIGASAGFLVIAAWYFVGLPAAAAHLLLLDRVPADRSMVGVGVGGFLLMALYCAADLEPADPGPAEPGAAGADVPSAAGRPSRAVRVLKRRVATGAVACGVLAFGLYVWAGHQFQIAVPQLGLGPWSVALWSAAAAVVVWATSARKVLLGGVVMVVFGAVVSLAANPLYRGVGPLTSSPLLSAFTSAARAPGDPARTTWLSLAGPGVNDVLVASGLPNVNGVQIYPDRATWKVLDPGGRNVGAWNRYANLAFVAGPAGSATAVSSPRQDVVLITLDPCGAAAAALGIGFVVSPQPVEAACLQPVAVDRFGPLGLHAYTRTASAPGTTAG
jgi:hypothetical protein